MTIQEKRGTTVQSCSDEPVEPEAMADECGDGFANAVVPLVATPVDQRLISVGIRGLRIFDVRGGLLEVRVREDGLVVGERPLHRVLIVEIEPSTRCDKCAHLFGPPVDTREPAQSPEADVDDVEGLRSQRIDRVVDICAHEMCPVVQTGTVGEVPCGVDRRGREIEAGHACTGASELEGVEAEMALEVQQAQPGDLSEGVDLRGLGPGARRNQPSTS